MKAFVLVNYVLGTGDQVIDVLKTIPEVKEYHHVFGSYDLVVELEAETQDIMRNAITWGVRKIESVRSTMTLMVTTRHAKVSDLE